MSNKHLLISADVVRLSGACEYHLLDVYSVSNIHTYHLWMCSVANLEATIWMLDTSYNSHVCPSATGGLWSPSAYDLVILYCIVQQTTARCHSRPGKLKRKKIGNF